MILRIMYVFTILTALTAAPVMAKVVTKVSDAPKEGNFLAYLIALVITIAVFAISFTGAKRVKEDEK